MELRRNEEPALVQAEVRKEDLVILKFQGKSFEVDKQKLSRGSLYFHSLFSGNFCDSSKKEIDIDYPVDLQTFQTFVDWLDDEVSDLDDWGHYYNKTVSKYLKGNYKELLELFRFASFYAIDNLLESLSYIIVLKWLQPDNLIDLWLMAEELSREDLEKAVFATCLDLFERVPQESILSLPKKNFDTLIKNVNLRCSEVYRQSVLNKWAETETFIQRDGNNEKGDAFAQESDQSSTPSRFLHCFTGFKTNANASEEATVFSWDGTKLEDLAKMTDGYKTYTQVGTQILGRGYNIYVVGGEKLLGHGTFNSSITRYCLLTRKWYRVERLPEERRHMVAVFLGNKLVLVGGVGKFRIKLNSVQVLDIHTGEWTKGAKAPVSFTDIPPSCTIGKKLIIATSGIYSYELQSNKWTTLIPCDSEMIIKNILHHDGKLYAFVQDHHDETIKLKVHMIDHGEGFRKDFTFVPQAEIKMDWSFNLISIDKSFVWFIIRNDNIEVEISQLQPEGHMLITSCIGQRFANVCLKSNVGSFSVLNPQALFNSEE